jgi:hypothetical protein
VTCGSVIKLAHIPSGLFYPRAHSTRILQSCRCLPGYRLHSHEVKYGSGSGQQSVTGECHESLCQHSRLLFNQDSPLATTVTAIGLFKAATLNIGNTAPLCWPACRSPPPPPPPSATFVYRLQASRFIVFTDSSHARFNET